MSRLSRKEFERRMVAAGWEQSGVFGYWRRDGFSMTELNYRRLADALCAFAAAAKQHDAEKAERASKRQARAVTP